MRSTTVATLEHYTHRESGAIRADVGSQWVVITVPYDLSIVTALKMTFPGYARRWCPELKKWYVLREYEDRLLELLRKFDYDVVWDSPSRRNSSAAKAKAKAKARQDPVSDLPPSTPPPHSPPPFSPAPPRFSSGDYALLEILPTARFEVAKAAYRALCMVYRPDQGGDVRKMAALNAAWERLCKKYGRR